jgi:hypothetical protein
MDQKKTSLYFYIVHIIVERSAFTFTFAFT